MPAALDVVGRRKQSSAGRMDAENLEVIPGNQVAPNPRIHSAAEARVYWRDPVADHPVEHRIAIPYIDVVRIGKHRRAESGIHQRIQLARSLHPRQRLQQRRVHKTKEPCRRADPERQRNDRDRGKPFVCAKPAHCQPKFKKDPVHGASDGQAEHRSQAEQNAKLAGQPKSAPGTDCPAQHHFAL